jgi:uncharacterized SAM-binding protein YcdF (DUF218 family)
MKETIIAVTFIGLCSALWIGLKLEKKVEHQQHRIEILQGDSLIIHTFFKSQSQKYDQFYNDWVNFKK